MTAGCCQHIVCFVEIVQFAPRCLGATVFRNELVKTEMTHRNLEVLSVVNQEETDALIFRESHLSLTKTLLAFLLAITKIQMGSSMFHELAGKLQIQRNYCPFIF